jgi:hypothetical protein
MGFAQKYSDYFNLIIMDNGSFHKALLLDWHDHVMPIYLPAYSPELNPIERLWEHTKKDLKWENYSSLDKLKEQVDRIIKSLTNEEVLSLCGWDYILEAILSAGHSELVLHACLSKKIMIPRFYQTHLQKHLTPSQFLVMTILLSLMQSEKQVRLERLSRVFPCLITAESRRRKLQRFLDLPHLTID